MTEQYPSAPAPQYYPGTPAPQKPSNGLGVAALVLGIVAILFSFIPIINFVAYIAGILAVIFGIIALVKKAPKGMPVTGLILGIVAIALASIINAITAAAVVSVSNSVDQAIASESAKADADHKIEYLVTVNDGEASINYGKSGSSSTVKSKKDWSKEATMKGNESASLSVTGDFTTEGQKLTCEIKLDGKSVDKQEGTSSVSCNADTY